MLAVPTKVAGAISSPAISSCVSPAAPTVHAVRIVSPSTARAVCAGVPAAAE
jgi:hypothetical protein